MASVKSVKTYNCSRHHMSFFTKTAIKQHFLECHRRQPNLFLTKPMDMKFFKRLLMKQLWDKSHQMENIGTVKLYYCSEHQMYTFIRKTIENHYLASHHANPQNLVCLDYPLKIIIAYKKYMYALFNNKTNVELM